MAINTPNWGINPFSDFNFTCKEVAIGGKLVCGTIKVSEYEILPMVQSPEHLNSELKQYLKTSMAHQMCEFMISNGLIEFTHMPDPNSFNMIVKARCYLAPSEQVRILRMHDIRL
jgi:hypothetical protein